MASPTLTPVRDLTVAVVRLPHAAHLTDIPPLEAEPDVAVRWVDAPEQMTGADLLLLPGSTHTIIDLHWLRERGLAEAVAAHSQAKGATVGIGAGYQMLGMRLEAPDGSENQPVFTEGLGVLPVVTRAASGQPPVESMVEGLTGLLGAWSKGQQLTGREISGGYSELFPGGRPAFRVVSRNGQPVAATDGCMVLGGWTFGSYVYGLFANARFRRTYLDALRARRGLR